MASDSGIQNNCSLIEPLPRHADIAARVGTHREGVTCELNDMQKAGPSSAYQAKGRALLVKDASGPCDLLEDIA